MVWWNKPFCQYTRGVNVLFANYYVVIMEGWERVKYIMEAEGMNKNSFSTAVGIGNNVTITRIINERRKPSRQTCEKIIARFPQYSYDWLYEGKGEILSPPGERGEAPASSVGSPSSPASSGAVPSAERQGANARRVETLGFMNVPLVPVRAQCGYLSGYSDEGYVESLPSLPVIVDREYHGKYMLFEASGDSMDNGTRESICDRDIVLGREIQRDLWRYKLHIKDWYFIIVHRTEGIAIKKIIDHDVEHGIITCHSLNNMFQDYRVYLDEVAELYNLIKIVDRSARL